MSRRTIIVLTCDKCKKENIPGINSLFVHTGWLRDPAGGPSERDGPEIELCPVCTSKALGWYLGHVAMELNEQFIKEFMK